VRELLDNIIRNAVNTLPSTKGSDSGLLPDLCLIFTIFFGELCYFSYIGIFSHEIGMNSAWTQQDWPESVCSPSEFHKVRLVQ
jgi:hypothetical protein